MLMRHVRAYSSSCSQVVLVYLHLFVTVHSFAAKNHKKFIKTPTRGIRSFKVIDVDTTKKQIISVCYDKQHVCAYLQRFSR